MMLPACQKFYDGMLDLGGILGFIHHDIRITIPEGIQECRGTAKHGVGIDQLVVKIHETACAHFPPVCLIDLGKIIVALCIQTGNFFLRQHAVLDIGDAGCQI